MIKTSCLLSCYKGENSFFLKDALISLKNQTLQADEIIIVEDGPLTDELYKVLDEFDYVLPLKRIELKKNVGLGNALNIGLKECSHDIVFRMDTDDIAHETRFEKQINYFQKSPDIDILGTLAYDIDSKGEILKERKVPLLHENIYKYIWTCPFIHPSVAFKKKSILKIGSYNTNIKRKQDYELWIRAASEGLNFANINEFLLYYRFTDEFFKKNNYKATFFQVKIGLKGLLNLRNRSIVAYVGVFVPFLRSLLPVFFEKKIMKWISKFDPRKK